MVSQFDFLARYAGYASISSDLEDPSIIDDAPSRTKLTTEILENTLAFPADSAWGEIFGIDPDEGTYIFPNSVILSSREILENHHLAIKKTETIVNEEGGEKTNEYYDNDSMIIVNGDATINLSSFSTKINNLKDSIDRGMPVIWWTINNSKLEHFKNHFMNIFGYEYWTGTDALGNTKTHLMFILRVNWGRGSNVYMDSDLLDAENGGFIFFEETHEKALVMPSDYNYECQYYFSELTKVITPTMGDNFTTKYLRAGYVDRYDSTNTTIIDQQISLSSKRKNAGTAYIHYQFGRPIEWIYLQASWWSTAEGVVDNALIQYKNNLGDWVTQFDLQEDTNGTLSSSINNKSDIKCKFDYPVTEFRIIVECNNASGNRNKGRLVIGALNIFFTELHTHSYTYTEFSSSHHLSTCDCGDSYLGTHTVSSSSMGRYKPCIFCGYLIDTDTDIVIVGPYSTNPNNLYTTNGSYVLPSGVVVLVDDDMQAYLDGTLIFYQSGSLIQ